MNKPDILALLRELPYDPKDYWVVAGGAMVLWGLREETADLDLGCTEELADRLEAEGHLHRRMADGNRWFRLGGDIEIFENWICDEAVLLDGFPVISIRGLAEMKKALGREKDLRDLELIKDFSGGAEPAAPD